MYKMLNPGQYTSILIHCIISSWRSSSLYYLCAVALYCILCISNYIWQPCSCTMRVLQEHDFCNIECQECHSPPKTFQWGSPLLCRAEEREKAKSSKKYQNHSQVVNGSNPMSNSLTPLFLVPIYPHPHVLHTSMRRHCERQTLIIRGDNLPFSADADLNDKSCCCPRRLEMVK